MISKYLSIYQCIKALLIGWVIFFTFLKLESLGSCKWSSRFKNCHSHSHNHSYAGFTDGNWGFNAKEFVYKWWLRIYCTRVCDQGFNERKIVYKWWLRIYLKNNDAKKSNLCWNNAKNVFAFRNVSSAKFWILSH